MVALRQEEVLITFADFVRMDQDGYFGDARHLELIDGRIYSLSPVTLHHARGQANIFAALLRRLEPRANEFGVEVVGAGTLHIDRLNAPEFDAAVIAPTEADYVTPDVCRLVVEATWSSRNRDLRHKPPVYAAAGVHEYWAVDRKRGRLHVFRGPVAGQYTDVLDPLGSVASIAPLFAPDIAIPVADLL